MPEIDEGKCRPRGLIWSGEKVKHYVGQETMFEVLNMTPRVNKVKEDSNISTWKWAKRKRKRDKNLKSTVFPRRLMPYFHLGFCRYIFQLLKMCVSLVGTWPYNHKQMNMDLRHTCTFIPLLYYLQCHYSIQEHHYIVVKLGLLRVYLSHRANVFSTKNEGYLHR